MHPIAPLLTVVALLHSQTTNLGSRLSDPAFRVREQAANQLVNLHQFAVPALSQIASVTEDPEAISRATHLVDHLTIQQDRLRRTTPLLVSQWRTSARVSTLFADLELQTGYRFVVPMGAESIRDRLIDDLKVMNRKPFWEVLDAIAEASGLEVSHSQPITRRPNNPLERPSYYSYSSYPEYASLTHREVENSPGAVPPLLLVSRSKETNQRIWRGNALRVQASPMTEEARSAFNCDTLPIELSVVSEPRLAWIKTLGIRSVRATAGDGLKLTADLTPALLPYDEHGNRGDILAQRSKGNLYSVQRNDDVERVWVTTDLCTSVVRLNCAHPITKLRELSGILRGIARSAPEEVVAVALKQDQMVTVAGQVNTQMKAMIGEQDEEGCFPIEVVVTFPAYRVMPANGSDRDVRTAEYAARAGRPIRRDSRGWYASDGPMIEGLSALTAKGAACTLSVSTPMSSAYSLIKNEVFIHRTFRFQARPFGTTKEPPSRLIFMASVERTVEAPFAIRDLPVLPGTGSRE